jgi:adenylate cyclase
MAGGKSGNSTEIELTYLAKELPPELASVKPQKVVDIYIPQDSSFAVLRLRQYGKTYEITKKTPLRNGDYSAHLEQTITLDKDEFEALKSSSNKIVEKNRYTMIIDGHLADVDIFTGPLEGLVVIDFEFDTVEHKKAFTPPSCCLADVTQELFVRGGQLAGCSYQDISSALKRYNYKQLAVGSV